ncbi:MAG: beta-ketoacyl-ACP synthase II [Trueperaceae bacterium]|nr:beta-ketoacyl-ACP synthase II [Trueperaceae bacterium]
MKRIVITGMGTLNPLGIGADAFHKAQLAGESGAGIISQFDASNLSCQIAAEVKADMSQWLDRKQQKRMDRFTQFALVAANFAFEDSGLELEKENLERIGTFVGCGLGGMASFEENARISHEKSPMRVSPFFMPLLLGNMAAAQIAMKWGFMGPSLDTVTACTSGADALGQALRALQHGEADVCFAGGAEAAITPLGIGSFAVIKALTTRNDEPSKASRPFAADRDGFLMGEGAGILVLETLEHAQNRGANIYAELKGYGRSTDAYHLTDPHPEGKGAALAMSRALAEAKLNPDEIGYLNAHATSTPAGDRAETLAIKQVFKRAKDHLAVSSTKSMTGHLLGAAGAVEAIASVQALISGILPPTINLDKPDPELDLDFIPNEAREQPVRYALSNSFGFGGHNAALVLAKV